MYFENLNEHTYVLRLEKNEEVLASIATFVKSKNIRNAIFNGLGSLVNPSLAFYNTETKKYSEKQLHGVFELTNLTGNIAWVKDAPVIHPHVTLSNESMQSFGGHLVKATVSATVEITLTIYPSNVIKEFDTEIGINLWKLKNEIVINKNIE